jgi:hypothetical protein
MTVDLFELLFRPDAFFQKRMAENENLLFPAIIVLVGAIIAGATGYLSSTLTSQLLGWTGLGTGLVTILSVICAFAGVFICWVIIAGIFYLVSLIFEGNGTFSRSLEAIGYGFLPLVLGYLVTLAVGLTYIPRIAAETLSRGGSFANPAAAMSATQAFMNDPLVTQYTRITMIVAIIFLLWSTYCWIFGMKHARQLTARDAAICVGVPVLLYIIYLLAMLLLSSALFRV